MVNSLHIFYNKKRERQERFFFSPNLIHEVFVEGLRYTRYCSWSWEYTSEHSKALALMSLTVHMLVKTQRKQV